MKAKLKVIDEHSKFWLGDRFHGTAAFNPESTMDLIELAAYRRAVGNFVYILTGRNIPVRFAENSTSLTDGKVIHIGGELSRGEFDPTVGLCLHEAMHIVKSDFDLIKLVSGKLPKSLVAAARGRMTEDALGKYSKFVLNVVEDRYIDAWAYENAPGYRGYYQALYNRYFMVDEITAALESDAFRTPTLRNYKFRFTNIINPASDLDALPALRKISEILDLENILRVELTSPRERLDLAFAITEEIVKSVVEEREQEKKKQKQSQDSKSESNDSEPSEEGSGDGEESESEDNSPSESSSTDAESNPKSDETPEPVDDVLGGTEACSDPVVEDSDEKDNENPSKDLSKKEIEKVEKLIGKQDEFILREMKQTAFTPEILTKLNILEQSEVNVAIVGDEEGIPKTECVVVKNMTKELMFSGNFPFSNKYTSEKSNPQAARGVQDGVLFGTMLGRKLQIRSEIKTTKFSRLIKGKIDRRLLSAIGFNGENLFYQTSVDKYKNVHLHVTVDASSSMANKWRKTMATVVAMAKAASMITNVTMSISFRTGTGNFGNEMAYVVIAYDSRKDKFAKITTLFPYLFPTGSTPEGLAFQAILQNIPASTHELDSYFVNLSDGEPAFNFIYHGTTAALHTKKQVNKIREMGVTVLSYFIEEDAPTPSPIALATMTKKEANLQKNERIENNTMLFKTMYGKDAQFIDVENIMQVAHTMNQKFLSKEN